MDCGEKNRFGPVGTALLKFEIVILIPRDGVTQI